MKKFSKKGVLLFAAAMALCAFAMPSMASAASWGVVGTEHTLDSPNLGFISDASGTSSQCTRSQFTVNVATALAAEITAASFAGCTVNGPATGLCTATSTATGLPWTATAVTTSNIQIHSVDIDVGLENHPGSTTCGAAGLSIRVTGTLTNGEWTGNGANQHEITLTPGTGARAAHGLVTHSALGNGVPATVTGTIRDTQQTLTVTN
jgi:hypothetical protein